MKKQLLFAALCLMSLFSISQTTNLVIFSEDGEPFYAFINGVKQNTKAETNVKVAGITPNISLRIEFENKALPKLSKTMSLETGFEHTARIKKDKKTQALKLQYFGQVPIAESTAGNVPTVDYHTAEQPVPSEATGVVSQGGSRNNSVTSTTTTSQVSNTNSHVSNVDVSMPTVGITMNVNTPSINTKMETTTSTTVTQSGSATTSGVDRSQTNTAVATAPTGCSVATTPANFAKMKQSVASKPFSDTKMSTAKVATKNSCLTVNQVKEIAQLFNMDEDKLAYAKYAYDYCVDKANYFQVSEVFSFSTTTDDFNKFLEQH